MLTQKDIEDKLLDLGLTQGDIVLLHSSLYSLGKVDGGAKTVIDAFLNVLGNSGTLVVPIFGNLGILTDELKNRENVVKSCCNGAIVAALGEKAKEICHEHWKAETLHGEDTPYCRIAKLGGYVCLLGVDHDRNTSLHSVEALLELPYLSLRTGTFIDEDGIERTETWKYFPGPHRDFIGLDKKLQEITKITKIGNAQVRLLKSQEMIDLCLEMGKQDSAFVLCDNNECMDCVRQRSLIFKDFLSQEEFTLVSSSKLAGYYVDEMIDNLTKSGISNIELDYIQGQPWFMYSSENLQKYVQRFTERNITICAARCNYIVNDIANIISLANDVEINRLILPINTTNEQLQILSKSKLTVDFFNVNQGAVISAEILKNIKTILPNSNFVFNPVNFVNCNEKPFLQSFRTGRFIKNIIQLDLIDQTFDGRPTKLAKGNGEVKELISILRCKSFDGYINLCSKSNNFKSVVKQFKKIFLEL